MSTQDYILTIKSNGANARFKIRYKNGRFNALFHLSGKLNGQKQHEALLRLCPVLENAILILQVQYKDRDLLWQKVEKPSKETLFSAFLSIYHEWYLEHFNMKPRINGIEGNALKSIVSHLSEVSEKDEDRKELFSNIFKCWDEIPAFYQSQVELRQINSNLNIILREIGASQAADTLDDKFKNIVNG